MKGVLAFILVLIGLLVAPYQMAPLYGEQRSSSVAGVHISAEQEKEISLILAEVSIQKIEQWVRIAGSLDPETKVVRGRVYGKDIPLIREGQKVHIYPLLARQPVLQGRVVRTFLDEKELIVETDLQPKLSDGIQV